MAYRRIGSDRLNMGIAGAVNSPSGTIITGDITRGEIVTYTTSSANVEYAPIRSRASGAVLLGAWYSNSGNADWNYQLEADNNRIAVKCGSATPCTFTWWVF